MKSQIILRSTLLALVSFLPSAYASNLTVQILPLDFSTANDGPFYLDFTLIGTAGNTVEVSDLAFGGGAAISGTGVSTGDVSGSLNDVLSLTDSPTSFYNDFYQEFTPGTALSFSLALTDLPAAFPDTLSISLLDSSLLPIPTLDPTGANTLATIELGTSTQNFAYASDPSQSGNGIEYPDIAQALIRPGSVQGNGTGTPEPSTMSLMLGAGLLLCAGPLRSRRNRGFLAGALLATGVPLCPSFAAAQCLPLSQSSASPIASPITTSGDEVLGVTLADFDGDGILDMAYGQNAVQMLFVTKGDGHGGFTLFGNGGMTIPSALLQSATDYVTDMVSGDFNHDGIADLAVLTAGGYLFVATGNGHGGFTFPASPAGTQFSGDTTLVAVDWNRDGYTDLLVAGSQNVALINAAGTLNTLAVLGNQNAAAVGDVNGDGYPDVVFRNGIVELNNGGGGFSTSSEFTPTAPFNSFATTYAAVIGDFNGDGNQDYLLTGLNFQNGVNLLAYQLFTGDGTGHFTANTLVTTSVISTNGIPRNLRAADFNGDGKLDFATVLSTDSVLVVFEGVGAGMFAEVSGSPYAVAENALKGDATLGDLNGDGRPDIVVGSRNLSSQAGEVVVYLANSKSVNLGLTTSANPAVTGTSLSLTAIVGGSGSCGVPSGTVTFSDNGAALGSAAVSNNTAKLTVAAGLASGIHTLTASYSGDTNFLPVTASMIEFVGGSTCSANELSQVQVTPGGFVYDRAHQQYVESVTVRNTGSSAITGPVSLALDSLSAGATLVSPAGYTGCATPANSPYVDLGICPGIALMPGGSVSATLRFSDPTMAAISYTPRVLAGLAPR